MSRPTPGNERDASGTVLCPTCGEPIVLGDPTLFSDDLMLHVDCWEPPPDPESAVAAEPEPA
jgi:hypothetical protein